MGPPTLHQRDILASLAKLGSRRDVSSDEDMDPTQIPYDIYRHQRALLTGITTRLYWFLGAIVGLLGLLLWRVW